MNHWLFKSEPEEFSIDHLMYRPKSTSGWDGVRNYQARNFMRDNMRVGDTAFFYHSNCKIPGIAGIIKVAKSSYPDPTAFDNKSKYYDPKSTYDNPRWFMVDVKFVEKFPALITLLALRNNQKLSNMLLLRPGNRLSITPVTAKEWQAILAMKVDQALYHLRSL